MSTIQEKFIQPKNYQKCSKNIWSEISQMVSEYKPLDLTIGCPDFLPSKGVTDTLAEVANAELIDSEQNLDLLGEKNLMDSLASLYSKLLKRNIDPQKELITMSTGCQSLHVILMSLVGPKDEVIIIEPYFDFYETLVNIAGGICRFVPLRPTREDDSKETLSTLDWTFDSSELERAFNENTKLFILNTPNNPSGKVFNLKELSFLSNLCEKFNVVCLADEVYEFMVYDPNEHIRIATLPGMWERTITMICPGKTFGVSGWELGVAYSSEELIKKLQSAHRNIVHTNNIPIQSAFAILYKRENERFRTDDSILDSLPKQLKSKRDLTIQILKEAGMKPISPEGGFFILADWTSFSSHIEFDHEAGKPRDFQFVEWMMKSVGLGVLPASSFFSEENKHLGSRYIRVCFYKKNETLMELANILKQWSKINPAKMQLEI